MKSNWLAVCILACSIAVGVSAAAERNASPQAQPVATGSLDFDAQVTPASGEPEPVRQLSFYLLRKSLLDIRKEAQQTEPPADMDKFIDSLQVSPELKAWMKKNRTVDFAGEDFDKKLTPDDVIKIPEFFAAYKNLNGAVMNVTVPASQVKESDRLKNPEKYKREQEKYQKEVEQYIHAHLESIDGLDAELGDVNPGRRWIGFASEQKRHAEQRALLLAQTEYLEAKAVSDLNGDGSFQNLPAGSYWITALDVPALAGDQRLEWDVPVMIRPGQTSRVELSNLNAVPPPNGVAH